MESTGTEEPVHPPEDFQDLVRDALQRLNDPMGLQIHPLRSLLPSGPDDTSSRGRALYRSLLGALEAMRPPQGTPPDSRAWRTYRILELRYIDGREVADVLDEISLSKNQYHRDHRRALQAISSLLWDDWRLEGRWHPAQLSVHRSAQDIPPISGREPAADENPRQPHVSGDPPSTSGAAECIDLAEVVEGVRSLLAPLYAQRGLELDVSIGRTPAECWIDRVALRHSLIAVLAHALKERGCRLVRISADWSEVNLTIRVGCHVDSDDLSALAGPLANGVAESRPFVESMAGRVSVHDASDGPEVLIVLPLVTRRRPTLLVVDNSPEFSQLVERYLAASEWMTRSATDVDSALAAIGHGTIGAVLLDIVLPDHDGWELLQRLKDDARTARVPVIVCSVLNEPDIALSLGASAYLQKPVTKQQLIDTLKGLLVRVGGSAQTSPL